MVFLYGLPVNLVLSPPAEDILAYSAETYQLDLRIYLIIQRLPL